MRSLSSRMLSAHMALLALILALCALTTARALYLRENAVPPLPETDQRWEEKSYADALKGYEAAVKANEVPAARKDEIAYRIVVALGKTKQWDRALDQTLAFLKAHRNTVWEPRGLYWFARLYLGVEHYGYKSGEKVTRGNDVPQSDTDQKPERVYLIQQDLHNARDAMEAARVLFPKYRLTDHTEQEEIALDFDLADVLQQQGELYAWANAQNWLPPADPSWTITADAAYSTDWAPPKKQLFLYAQIQALANTQPDKSHQQALALLDEALWLRQYQRFMKQAAQKWENAKPIPVPYPYQDLGGIDTLRQLVHDFPSDAVSAQAQYTIGQFEEEDSQFVSALKDFRQVSVLFPTSKWTEDARFRIHTITYQSLSLSASGMQTPGSPASLNLAYRNLTHVHFAAYRVHLEDVLGSPTFLNDPLKSPTTVAQLYASLDPVREGWGKPVAEWDAATEDKGDYQYGNLPVKTPFQKTGAYVVVAGAGDVKTATILTLSDLVLVQRIHRDGGLMYATEAKTGAPVKDAHIISKIWYYQGSQVSEGKRSETNVDGIADIAFPRAPGRNNFIMATLAYSGERYALTNQVYSYDYGDNPDRIQSYSVTDRTVYRPGQHVQYRQIVLRRQNGKLQPVAGETVRIVVSDPQSKQIYETTARSNAFGSVHGEFTLESGAPLGEYYLNVNIPSTTLSNSQAGGSRFRVEEYKKPEFEVNVTAAAERVKLGQPTSATISARYYFGAPVPGAHVSYRIYRNYYAQSYHFPQPFEFLYRYSDNGDYNSYYRNGEVITQGTATTDASGDAHVTFATAADKSRWGASDLSYTIEADVQDASRRTISGTGSVKATRHDVAAFLNFAHGYATQGDRVDVEVRTLNPSDVPVSASGLARVYLQPTTPDAKESLVHSEPLTTDRHGRGYIKWTADKAGYYRIAFETKDSGGEAVSGSVPVWVSGPELAKSRFLFSGVFLALANPYYEEGQTAKMLLVTPERGCTVLLTREANNEILDRRVIHVPGTSMELPVPLAERDVPNVFFSAILVRDEQVHQATQELFVPPVRQLLNVSVVADREQYQPGEKAHLRLSAHDWRGKPVATELSVAVTDASLNYIQKDYAPDIRSYYYGDRRSESIQVSLSTGAVFSANQEDNQPKVEFKPHEWMLPEGMGQIADWPGGQPHNYYYWNWGYGYGYGMPGFGGRWHGGIGGFSSRGGFGRNEVSRDYAGYAEGGMAMDSLAMGPQAAAAEPVNGPMAVKSESADRQQMSDKRSGPGGGLAPVSLRTKFADTAFWTPAVVTNAQGEASVDLTWPDNLTQWRAQAIGNSASAQVGTAQTHVTTKKNLLVRLQAPRFFVERDRILVSGNIHNYLPKTAHIRVRLDLASDNAVLADPAEVPGQQTALRKNQTWIDVPTNSQKRVDWVLKVEQEGELRIRLTAQSELASDATEMSFPVLVHGAERAIAQNGVLRQQNQARLAIEMPKERKAGSSELVVQLNPSLAAILLDALPYLNDYPYGCVEQTVSRFIPSVVTAHTLHDLGYSLQDLKKRAQLLAEREQGNNAPAPQAHSPYTYPQGRPGRMRTAHLSEYLTRLHSPVFDTPQLDAMIGDGLRKLASLQHSDGGWGWWPGDGSDAFMSAYVLYGLQTGKEAGVAVDENMLTRGFDFLKGRFLEDDDLHRMAYEARVLGMDARYRDAIRPLATGRLFERRERLSAYSKALLALALHEVGDAAKAHVLLRNVETTAHIDEANATANWDGSDRYWWRWYNDKVETNATVLQAYLAIDPTAQMPNLLVKWLVNNRRGNTWYSTRETALAVFALADYTRLNRELDPDYTLTVDLGGRMKRTYTVNRANALFFDNAFVVPDSLLQTGANRLTLTKSGRGSCYFGAYSRYFSLEDPLQPTGNEIYVTRRYFRLLADTARGASEEGALDPKRANPFLSGHYALLTQTGEWRGWEDMSAGPRYQRVGLKSGETVRSGDLLEVELQIESKNDYEYLIFEDMKPSGCEPTELRSGWHAGMGVCSNIEFRDQKVAFFVRSLAQGKRTLTYRLRAQMPGRFHVLPTNGYAMYAPDIRALSSELHLNIKDEDAKPLALQSAAR